MAARSRARSSDDRLAAYRAKRDFTRTAEPPPTLRESSESRRFVVQKHAARRLHYDVRLEHNGVLLSWAVPKGPSLDPADKRLAVRVEDHPVDYAGFEGVIPPGAYGAGTVMLWDEGRWEPHGDVDAALADGRLSFTLHGKRLRGRFALIRMRQRRGAQKENWLLIKERDDAAASDGAALLARNSTSVRSSRTMPQIAAAGDTWRSTRADTTAAGKGRVTANRPKTAVRTRSAARTKPTPAAPAARRRSATGASTPPPFVAPQLATLAAAAPDGAEWLHEIKYDGYRALAAIGGGRVVIRTRSGLDWTAKFAPLVPALAALPCRAALLDGEIAVADAAGRTDFGALQEALARGSGGFAYYLFDLLHLDGTDLRRHPLVARKQRLENLLAGAQAPLAYSSHLRGQGPRMLRQACALGLEGIVCKRAEDSYRSGRTTSWLKVKCGQEQEFVIIGWQPSEKAGRPFASLLLAVRENGTLRYCGRVGTGFSGALLDDLAARLERLSRRTPAATGVPAALRTARFVAPQLVAAVRFAGWTRDGMIRQGVFKGLREDKPAQEVVRERPMQDAQDPVAAPRPDTLRGITLTNPDRILYAEQGISKRELAAYYDAIADRMLPYIRGRPLALVRCPRGQGTECFFQKHAARGWPDAFGRIRLRETSRAADYLVIEDARGLVASAQMGVLELHIWCARADAVEQPDRMVFDLDPDPALAFAAVQEAAFDLRTRLDALGLRSFALVTGGKGVHVVVPLARGHGWDEHRDFAEAIARLMAQERPDRYVATMAKAKRRGRIFIDYLRNQRGATAIAPYSTRARAGAPIALPVSWDALAHLGTAQPVTVREALRHCAQAGEPWPDYHALAQALPRLSR